MIKYVLFLLIAISLLGSGCKTEFEKIRESADPEKMYTEGLKLFEQGDYLRSQMLFELSIPYYRGKKEAETLFFKYAQTHFNLEKYLLAAHYFERFTASFPDSEYKEDSDYMVAFSYYNMSPRYRLDQTYTEKSINSFQSFANTYPSSDKLQSANLLIDEMRRKQELKAFENAELYYNLRKYQAATASFENLLKDFPETPEAEKIRYLIVKSHYNLAVNSVVSKQEERFTEALKNWRSFKKRYPESEYTKELIKIAEDTRKKLKSLQDV